MRLLDKYVAKNFLTGYAIAFCVLIGLRIMLDLFVNIDEFTEHSDLGVFVVMKNILVFYAINLSMYFRDFAGMILVVAASFSLGKMVRNNELVAIMTSGVSLRRVIAPIVIMSLILTGILIIDQEVIIPHLSDKLVRSHDDLPGNETYDIWFLTDENGSLICSHSYDVKKETFLKPTIVTRVLREDKAYWIVTGRIDAESGTYDADRKGWALNEGRVVSTDYKEKAKAIDFYASDLKPKDIPVMRQSDNKSLLSSGQLAAIAAQRSKVRDMAELYGQRHFRITEPLVNLVMLLLSLPLLVCRDPKSMKSAVLLSFMLTGACMVTSFVSKLMAAEPIMGYLIPQFWAWLPIFIFFPVAALEVEAMKT